MADGVAESTPSQMPGNFVIVLGDDEAKSYLHDGHAWVNRFMTDLSDDIAEHARDELLARAPGHITELVGLDPGHLAEPGVVEAIAGVKPDVTEETLGQGLGSSPADFPVYVEVGTGIYGPEHRSIVMPPGRIMVFDWENRRVRTPYIEGQPAQHYAEEAYESTVHWVPVRLARTDIMPEGGT